MTDPARWRWGGADFTREDGGVTTDPVLVDSWLTHDGHTRAWERHVRRFTTAAQRRHGIDPAVSATFMAAAADRLPGTGRWFPRVELRIMDGRADFALLLRPAPPPGRTVRLWVPDGPDRRRCPAVKGPDLPWLTGLRAEAVARGADDAILLGPDGRVRETATTSLLWWRGDVLCVPPTGPDVLPGITRAVLLDLARSNGTEVRWERPGLTGLADCELWTVNALHGIRPVIGWIDDVLEPVPAPRAVAWQAALAVQ